MKVTNVLNLPQPFVDAATSDYKYTPKRYSVTQLLKGTREAILQRRHADEIESDVADMVWAIFGSAVHSILEKSQESETQFKETRLAAEMPNGYTLSGIFDLYDDETGTVTDYKTASVWKAVKGEWDDYRTQVLIYCWMLRQIGFDARRGEIVALLKDHSKSKARFDRSYPQHPVVTVGWDFTDDDIEEIGRWLEGRFDEIAIAEQLPDENLPLCLPSERWAQPEKWAVMKRGRKSAVKLYDTEKEAQARAENENRLGKSPDAYYVEHRPGADNKCVGYCSAAPFCDYWRERYGAQ